VACGDANGELRLFRYPCLSPTAYGWPSLGVTARIPAVRFMPDSKALISAGPCPHPPPPPPPPPVLTGHVSSLLPY
jgi:hypothetical protein